MGGRCSAKGANVIIIIYMSRSVVTVLWPDRNVALKKRYGTLRDEDK